MATASQTAPTRTVVLLHPAERKRLKKLAAAERVSSGEIIRRSLRSYEKPMSSAEEEVIAMLLAQMNSSLSSADIDPLCTLYHPGKFGQNRCYATGSISRAEGPPPMSAPFRDPRSHEEDIARHG